MSALMQPEVHEITFHLAACDERMKWWCPNCRGFLFFAHHRLISLSEDGPAEFLKPPITIICPKCRWHIHLQTIV